MKYSLGIMNYKPGSWIILVALFFASLGARAACVGENGASNRHPTVNDEFHATPWVLLGRVVSSRTVSSADDPGFYEWTVYDIEVTKAFKGHPPQLVKLLSENSSGRFDMDSGKPYLLFVSRSRVPEMEGKEKLPRNYVDNCGNSGAVNDVQTTITIMKGISQAR